MVSPQPLSVKNKVAIRALKKKKEIMGFLQQELSSIGYKLTISHFTILHDS